MPEEMMTEREITQTAQEIAQKAMDAKGVEAGVISEEEQPNAISDLKVAEVAANYDKNELESVREKIEQAEDEKTTDFLENQAEQITNIATDHEMEQKLPNAAAEVVLERELDPTDPQDVKVLDKSKGFFARLLGK